MTEKDGVVSMPLDYWMSIVRYTIDVDTAKKIYEEWKHVQGN